MKYFLALAIFLVAVPAFAGDVYVQGHYRSDGTYVQPHYQSAPNNSTYDNWSTRGNINPYTGEEGTQDRDRQRMQSARPPGAGTYNSPYDSGEKVRGQW